MGDAGFHRHGSQGRSDRLRGFLQRVFFWRRICFLRRICSGRFLGLLLLFLLLWFLL